MNNGKFLWLDFLGSIIALILFITSIIYRPPFSLLGYFLLAALPCCFIVLTRIWVWALKYGDAPDPITLRLRKYYEAQFVAFFALGGLDCFFSKDYWWVALSVIFLIFSAKKLYKDMHDPAFAYKSEKKLNSNQ